MQIATAFVEIRPDTKNFRRDLQRDTERDAKEIGRTLGQALAGGAFLAGVKKSIDAASNLNEAANVTSITFGKADDKISAFAKTAARDLGLSERAARQAAASYGGLLLNLGFTEDAAADTSISLTKLASDMASAFNTDPADAALALGSALRGEQEPILRYNVLLSDMAVREKAVELGLAGTTAAVDSNGKVQARLALIMEQTSRIQGDFANTSTGAANAQRIAAAVGEDSAASLGQTLLPVYERIVAVVTDVVDVFGKLPEPVQTAVVVLAGIAALSGPVTGAAQAIGALATIVRTRLASGMETAALQGLYLKDNLGKVALGAGALGAALVVGSIILGDYQKKKADAARIEQSYTDILAEQTDGVGENTAAFAGSELLKGKLGEALRDAGVDVEALTTGIADSAPAVAALGDSFEGLGGLDELGDLKTGLDNAGLSGSALADELLRLQRTGQLTDSQLNDLVLRLGEQADGYIVGAREAGNKGAADEAAGVAAGGAAPKVEGLTDALTADDQAAKDAAESVDLFREAVERALAPLDFEAAVDARAQALNDLASGIDERARAVADARDRIDELQAGRSGQQVADSRQIADAERALAEARGQVADTDAERASRTEAIADAERSLARAREDSGGGTFERDMADAQAELQAAIDGTSLSLTGNSEAALRNRDELRNLIDDSVGVIESARDQGRSLDDLKLIRAGEVQSLRDQLTGMGYTRAEVDRYIARIEAIPLTKATTLTLAAATAIRNAEAFLTVLANIDKNLAGDKKLRFGASISARDHALATASGHAAGGDVFDGDFVVGEAGPELLRKQGASVEVIAGARPTPAGFDGVGEDQLLTQREMAALLRQIAANTTSGTGLRRVALTAGV